MTRSSTDLTLRRYRPADAEAVWDLHLTALEDAGLDVDAAPPGADADLRDVVANYLESGGDFLVGERADEIVAMGAFRPLSPDEQLYDVFAALLEEADPSTVAVLKRMRVEPAHQREGYGQRVLDELERRATDAGFRTLVLETNVIQTSAQAFYEANGFDRIGRESFEHDGDVTELLFYRKAL